METVLNVVWNSWQVPVCSIWVGLAVWAFGFEYVSSLRRGDGRAQWTGVQARSIRPCSTAKHEHISEQCTPPHMLPELLRTTLTQNQSNSLSQNDDSSPLLDVLWADAVCDVIGCIATKTNQNSKSMSQSSIFYYILAQQNKHNKSKK